MSKSFKHRDDDIDDVAERRRLGELRRKRHEKIHVKHAVLEEKKKEPDEEPGNAV
jgi:hypothetical protein